MKTLVRVTFLLLALVLVFGVGNVAKAGDCGGGYGYGGWGGGIPWYFSPYVDQKPPYFSTFPPVYYQHPVIPRSYGWSPFPLRANDTGPTAAIQPKTVINPHVKPLLPKEDASQKTAARPKVIYNPYVVENGRAELASDGS